MHPEATVTSVLELHQAGLNNCEISRRTGVSRPTIRDWVNGCAPRSYRQRDSLGAFLEPHSCQRCGGEVFDRRATPATAQDAGARWAVVSQDRGSRPWRG